MKPLVFEVGQLKEYSVEIGQKYMEQEPEPPLVEITAETVLWWLGLRFGRMAVLAAEMEELTQEIQQEIECARQLDVTWVQIGEVAGVRPQPAYQRWNGTGREKHRVNQRKRRVTE